MSMHDTEALDAAHADLDLRTSADVVLALLDGQHSAFVAVSGASGAIARAADAAAARLAAGEGRLMFAGAGASGRLAAQDGAELWPTFGWPAERLHVALAGGRQALLESVEGAEDDGDAAREEVARLGPGVGDVVLALAASGRSPWTLAWLDAAGAAGALTVGMANNPGAPLLERAAVPILLETGPEVLAGSTRMAAGTAQKIALNLFSTTTMIRLHRTYGNLMVDMAATNRKLDARRVRILRAILPQASEATAEAALAAAGGWIKLAVLLARGEDTGQARERLARHGGSLRRCLSES